MKKRGAIGIIILIVVAIGVLIGGYFLLSSSDGVGDSGEGSGEVINCGDIDQDIMNSQEATPDDYFAANPGEKEKLECTSNNLKDCKAHIFKFVGDSESTFTATPQGDNCIITYESDGGTVECQYTKEQIVISYEAAEARNMGYMTSLGLTIGMALSSRFSSEDSFEMDFDNPNTGQEEKIPCTKS